LSAKTPATVAAGSAPFEVAVSPNGKSVYVTNFSGGNVSEFDVGAGGLLSAKTPATVLAGTQPLGIAVSPDGNSVYVTNFGGGNVSQYDVGAGGLLSAKTPTAIAAGTAPIGVAVSPDGNSVYVANRGGGVSQYNLGAGGVLSAKTPATVAAGSSPQWVAASPDGRSVYVTNNTGANVSQYDVGAGGVLSAKTPATVPVGANPDGVVLLPDQGPLAAFSVAVGRAGSASAFDGSSSSDPDGTIARYDWEFGDGTTLPNGGPTPTHTYAAAGAYTARLTVTDDGGCSSAFVFTGQTALCNGSPAAITTRQLVVGAPPPPPPDTTPPTETLLKLTPTAFRAARSGPSIAAKTGTTVSYTVSEAAVTSFKVERAVQGVKRGHTCVRPSRRTRRGKRCTRFVAVRGSFTHADIAGANRFHFSGRIGGKALKAGNYRLNATPKDTAGNVGRTVRSQFHIVR
jgi:DNA-binding beta-propeller fold protein YncE